MTKNNKNRQTNPMSNPKTMGKEGMRIMKDIAYGKYNFYAEGHVFRNLEFVKAIINEINKRLIDLNIEITAIQCTYYGTTDNNVLYLLNRKLRMREAYDLINQTMINVYQSGGDTGFVTVLLNQLPKYKYNI